MPGRNQPVLLPGGAKNPIDAFRPVLLGANRRGSASSAALKVAGEQYANAFTTTLAASLGPTDGVMTVAAGAGELAPLYGPFRVLIDNEYISVQRSERSDVWTIVRGIEPGHPPADHAQGATVTQIVTVGGLRQVVLDGLTTISEINVKVDFGAAGDGVADDTQAIQNAINAVPTSTQRGGTLRAGTILFPAGQYVVSSPITFPLDSTFDQNWGCAVKLEGVGGAVNGGVHLIRAVGFNGPILDVSGTIDAQSNTKRIMMVEVKSMILDGNSENSPATAPLLRTYYSQQLRFRDVQFRNNSGPAIEGVEYQDSLIESCDFNCMGVGNTSKDGTTKGRETLRLLSHADGNPAAGTFGYSPSVPTNNIWVRDCHFTPAVAGGSGAIAISLNRTSGGSPAPHRCYFVSNKIEIQSNIAGSACKIFGGGTRANRINFINIDFSGYGLAAGQAAISWVEADTAYNCEFRNCSFDDANTTGVTHAPFKLTDCEYWTIDGVLTFLGAAGGEANPAALVDCVFSNSKPLVIGNVWHSGARTTPWFSNATITDRRLPPRGGTFTSTTGAVATVNIPHGLGYTPQIMQAYYANVAARDVAVKYHVTADATNVILNFSGNLTAATSYSWNWIAS